ncbi:hypothetical protein Ahia01_000229100 [Argonauta hians]
MPLFPEDSMDADDVDDDVGSSRMGGYPLSEEMPLIRAEGQQGIPDPALPGMINPRLQPPQRNSYEHLMQEYGNEPIDVQRERSFQENPLLNYIYRRRRELQDTRSPRTKRGLYIPQDSQPYMSSAEIPAKVVTLDSWPNAYSQSELLEKEAPYEIDNTPLDTSFSYGKRYDTEFDTENEQESLANEIDPESLRDESVVAAANDDDDDDDDDEGNMPYEEVVLHGQPGYFVPAKRVFFPYAEEPQSHYSGLVNNKRGENYSRLLELARALAVQREGALTANEDDIPSEK